MFQTFFYQPILNLVIFLYNVVPGHDLGIAIILLTIIVKLLLYPLAKKSITSQKELQELQPKIEEIKKKYKDQKEEQGKQMMKLYSENKVNPLSSCLPLVIQLPFMIAIFRVFRNGFTEEALNMVYPFITRPEVVEQNFLGLMDLAIPSLTLAVLAGAAQFWQAKMLSMKKPEVKTDGSKDESMATIMNKQMLYFMPFITVIFAKSFPGGLALYWLTSTLLTGFQQLVVFKEKKEDKKEEK